MLGCPVGQPQPTHAVQSPAPAPLAVLLPHATLCCVPPCSNPAVPQSFLVIEMNYFPILEIYIYIYLKYFYFRNPLARGEMLGKRLKLPLKKEQMKSNLSNSFTPAMQQPTLLCACRAIKLRLLLPRQFPPMSCISVPRSPFRQLMLNSSLGTHESK